MKKVSEAEEHRVNEGQVERPLILLVEDDFELRVAMSSELAEELEILEADNGQDGLEKAQKHVPDLVVTDIMMPVMDGLELCQKLRENIATSHIPIVMLTAQTSVENQIEGLESGADDYVMKPFHMEVLLARIHNLLKVRKQLWEAYQDGVLFEKSAGLEPAVEQKFIRKAEAIVKENLSDHLFTSDEFAAALNFGVRSLQRKMKAVAGISPARFISEVRMAEAARLLTESALTVTEIAFEVGCEDSSNFTKAFKKQFDQTPSNYRASHT